LPARDGLFYVAIGGLASLFVVGTWAWKAAKLGGFPIFSVQTLHEIGPYVILLVIALAVAIYSARD
jgi:hypothetical protein